MTVRNLRIKIFELTSTNDYYLSNNVIKDSNENLEALRSILKPHLDDITIHFLPEPI